MTQKRTAFTLVELIVVVLLGYLMLLLMTPTCGGSAREGVRTAECNRKLERLSVALRRYYQDHGGYPPAYTTDFKGNRLHSWRTLILPYLGQRALYESIDLRKPWDDPANTKARETDLEVLKCPSGAYEPCMTTYLAVVGTGCAFSEKKMLKVKEVRDTLADTIFVVDVDYDRAVHWMSPNDLELVDGVLERFVEPGNHAKGFHVIFGDGRVATIDRDITPEKLAAMLTIAGGEKIEE